MYLGYFSDMACELAGWGLTENNRVKASKILSLAEKIETEYRKAYNIPVNHNIWHYKPYVNQYKFGKLPKIKNN